LILKYESYSRDKRIMLVDDEVFCNQAMAFMLQSIGIDITTQVDVCTSGEEAMAYLRYVMERGFSY
jgi:CheY-like chemotaxis protein